MTIENTLERIAVGTEKCISLLAEISETLRGLPVEEETAVPDVGTQVQPPAAAATPAAPPLPQTTTPPPQVSAPPAAPPTATSDLPPQSSNVVPMQGGVTTAEELSMTFQRVAKELGSSGPGVMWDILEHFGAATIKDLDPSKYTEAANMATKALLESKGGEADG